MKVKEIHFLYPPDNLDVLDHNEDVEVKLKDGRTLSLTVFTIKNIISLMSGYRDSGECMGGKYFYCKDMLIVEKFDRENIKEYITNIIESEGVIGPMEIVDV